MEAFTKNEKGFSIARWRATSGNSLLSYFGVTMRGEFWELRVTEELDIEKD